jgi:hypothetical protein
MRRVLVLPAHPERICWGCEKYCPADDLACGNGTIRTPHPCELFGDDWLEWSDSRLGARARQGADCRNADQQLAHPGRRSCGIDAAAR